MNRDINKIVDLHLVPEIISEAGSVMSDGLRLPHCLMEWAPSMLIITLC